MKTAWYREPWAWFVLFFPMLAVIAGISTFIIFNNNAPSMVSDDYYKDGKKINKDLSKYEAAVKRNITFELTFNDGVAEFTKRSGDIMKNQAIKISFFHVTLEKYDMEELVSASGNGSYRVTMPADMLEGKWRVRIESFDGAWRLQKYVTFPNSQLIILDGE